MCLYTKKDEKLIFYSRSFEFSLRLRKEKVKRKRE